jgi:hypothetical protein
VNADFEVYGGALGLTSCCLYGGAPYQPQKMKLERGVDIVIGTPGRIKVNYSLAVFLFLDMNIYSCNARVDWKKDFVSKTIFGKFLFIYLFIYLMH